MLRVAVGQFTAKAKASQNLLRCKEIIQKASSMQAEALFLPEASDFIRPQRAATSTEDDFEFLPLLQAEALNQRLWIFCGIHEPVKLLDESNEELAKYYNTHVAISPEGQIHTSYRKIHLFDVDLSGISLHIHIETLDLDI
jgi:predicted amidohydrolase